MNLVNLCEKTESEQNNEKVRERERERERAIEKNERLANICNRMCCNLFNFMSSPH